MFYRLLAVSTFILGTLGWPAISLAEAASSEEATLVVYRVDESVKTGRVKMNIHVDEASMGRIKAEDGLVFSYPAGEYTLSSSIRGTKELVVTLAPGQTYYVHAQLEMRGSRVTVSFLEVEEQIARVQQPQLHKEI